MSTLKDLFEPQNEEEREEDWIEELALSIQLALQACMNERGVSQKDLARKLGISAARVSQILSSQGANLTVRTIARISRALDEEFEILPKKRVAKISERGAANVVPMRNLPYCDGDSAWVDETANVNRFPDALVA
ncbi:helix-turn-helix domain-containing protein [Rhodobacteraceae bacterium 2CG4]|uniref:Helix-turn-helix domain-containing protein n=1 Tax=Halovulum marinum TaxID=2662447 RepID=A0A6L5YX81_9RHOB|nr:helix-turn-helix transcriptional regulator [Halovulum marinum]MSU88284.1 helix-turn-helix domain-containing protein [Halovulum marinum]